MNAEPFEIELAKRLQSLREAAGKTQEEAAVEMGLKRRETVRNWETVDRHIKVSDLKMLCEYYGVSADVLLGLPTDTAAYDVYDACKYTGLSVEAAEQLHRMNEKAYTMTYISRLLSRRGRDLNDALQRIALATQAAGKLLSGTQDPEGFYAVHDAKTDLELALFTFEQLCRDIYSEYGSVSVLRQITELHNDLVRIITGTAAEEQKNDEQTTASRSSAPTVAFTSKVR